MPSLAGSTWPCPSCTLVNKWSASRCIACGGSRDPEVAAAAPAKKPGLKKLRPAQSQSEKPEKKAKLRQAEEKDGVVALLCHACRHDKAHKSQAALSSFFGSPAPVPANHCSRCRKPLTKPTKGAAAPSGALPHIERIKAYRRLAKDGGVPYELSDAEAARIMRSACSMCGVPADPERGHGITRLRVWPEHLLPLREACSKPYMGPFTALNVAAACATCNLMKGARRVGSFVKACRHIATSNGLGDYGSYPERFRNNTSKRSRSSYITASSTHTKTHMLTNEEFNEITARPCRYCGKESDPKGTPPHHNGLDRLDSSNRVYSTEAVVSCCGDCNIMKYSHSLEFFLEHVGRVAEFNVGNEEVEAEGGGAEEE
ncbi:hypothetical protein TeGR_g4050, partial [Tetraparma gracilis]